MTVSPISNAATAAAPSQTRQSLGQADFLRLLTTQLQQQDPTEPVDNNQMIAQMAQITSAAGIGETNAMLQGITDRLDFFLAAQFAAQPTQNGT
jgi:flagellar basal-body rod modification protein FlgD